MQKEPKVAVAIGCKQLSLHNRCVSSVYLTGEFHMLNSAIDIQSSYPWT